MLEMSQKQMISIPIAKAFTNAKHAHDEIFKENPREHVITGHLSIACSYLNSARSIYVCNLDTFERSDIDNFFHQFDVFIKEVMTNIRTDHSHQWSNIEFENLSEKYEVIKDLFNLV